MSAKSLKGKVVSTKMEKTVVVAVEMPKRHKLYDKVIKKTKRIKAHTDLDLVIGDNIVIQECRPYSKEISWKVVEKVEVEGKSK